MHLVNNHVYSIEGDIDTHKRGRTQSLALRNLGYQGYPWSVWRITTRQRTREAELVWPLQPVESRTLEMRKSSPWCTYEQSRKCCIPFPKKFSTRKKWRGREGCWGPTVGKGRREERTHAENHLCKSQYFPLDLCKVSLLRLKGQQEWFKKKNLPIRQCWRKESYPSKNSI